MTDIIKLAYEQGQMQALADLGLIKDAGLMDKAREVASGLFGKARKGLNSAGTSSASRDEWVKLDGILEPMPSSQRRLVQKNLKALSPSERTHYINYLEDGDINHYKKLLLSIGDPK